MNTVSSTLSPGIQRNRFLHSFPTSQQLNEQFNTLFLSRQRLRLWSSRKISLRHIFLPVWNISDQSAEFLCSALSHSQSIEQTQVIPLILEWLLASARGQLLPKTKIQQRGLIRGQQQFSSLLNLWYSFSQFLRWFFQSPFLSHGHQRESCYFLLQESLPNCIN